MPGGPLIRARQAAATNLHNLPGAHTRTRRPARANASNSVSYHFYLYLCMYSTWAQCQSKPNAAHLWTRTLLQGKPKATSASRERVLLIAEPSILILSSHFRVVPLIKLTSLCLLPTTKLICPIGNPLSSTVSGLLFTLMDDLSQILENSVCIEKK